MATYQFFDAEKIDWLPGTPDVKANPGYALALGYRFTPAYGLELNYGKTKSETDASPSIDARDSRVSVDGYYAFNTAGSFSPYLLLGAGQGDFKLPTMVNADRNSIIDAGIGAFYRFTDRVALRGEIRNVTNLGEGRNDQLAMLGLEFSPHDDTASAPAPEPVVQPEPAAAPIEQLAAPAPVVVTPVDSDNDGVADDQDKCPETLAGVKVDAMGCPLDSDNDGVPDYLDKCPDTPAGAAVDNAGCPEKLAKEVSIDLNINFVSGKADIHGDDSAEIAKVADFMKKYPDVKVTIEGYTDNRGNAAMNKKLSQKRAEAVKEELVKSGVDASRLSAVGYGAANPIADNKTEEGRAKNRRVVATAKAQTEEVKMKQ
jgi:OOP family OmpA-OmpF porin